MSESPPPVTRTPLWVKALLVVSLVANFAFAGLVLGVLQKDKERSRGSERQISWILRFMPETRRAEAERLFDNRREELRRLYRERPKFLEQVVTAIRAEPFAPESLEAAMRARRTNSDERRLIVEETLVKLLSGFTQDERVHFADALDAQLDRAKRRDN